MRLRAQSASGSACARSHCWGSLLALRAVATVWARSFPERALPGTTWSYWSLEGLEHTLWYAFEDGLPATQTTREKGPLIVRSPGRVPILPIKETVQEPKPKKGFKKVKKDC